MKAHLRLGSGVGYLKERAAKGDEQAAKDIAPLSASANVIVWEAFRLLNMARDTIFEGVAGLKISEIVTVLNVLGVEDEKQKSKMVRYLIAMDGVYKDWKLKHGK